MKLYSDRPCIAFSSGPASHLRESSSSSPSAMSSSSLKVSSLSRPGSQVASLGASQTMVRSYAMSLKSSLATAKAPATTTTTIPVDKENGHQHLPPPLSRASLSTDKVSLRDITANDDVDECYQEEDDDDLEEEVHSLYDHHSSPHHHHLLRDRNGASTADKGNVSSGLLVGASSAPPPLTLISGAQSSLEYAPGVKAKQMSVASSVHALLNGGQEKGKKTKTNTSTVGTKSGVLGDSSGAHSSGSSSGTSSRSGSSTDIDALVDDGLSSLGSSALSSSASSPPPPLQHDAASASTKSEGNPIVDVAKAASASPKGTATAAASSVGQSCQQTTAAVTVTSSSARRLSPSSLAIASSGLLVSSSSSSTSSSAYSLDSSSYSDFPYSASSSSSSTAPSPPLTSHHSPNSQHHQHRVGHLPQQQQQASYHCTTPKPSAHHSSHFNQLRQQQQLHSVSGPLANLLPYSGYQHAYQLQPSYEGSVPQTAFGRMTFAEPLTYGHHPQLMGASSAERRRHSTHLNFAFNHETAVNHGDGHRVSGGQQQQQRHRQAIYPNAASQQQQQQQHASLSLSCLAGVKDQLELLTLSVQQQQEEQDANNNCIERPRRDTLNNSLTSGPFVSSPGDLVHEETLTNGGACLTFTPPLPFTSEKEDSSTQAASGPLLLSQHSKQQQQLVLPQQQQPQPKQKSRVPFQSQSQSPSSYYPSLSSLIAERKSAWLDGPLSDLILKTYTHRRQPKTLLEYKCTLQEAITRSLTAHLRAPDGSPLSFKLYLIGSSLTSIGSLHSDIDLCMVLYNPKTGTVDESYHNRLIAETMLSRMSAILEKAGLAYQCKVIRANVPILKFFDQNHIEVNINLNKLVTVQNTMLLVRLCALDARVAPFLFTVKLWAAKNGINCAYFKSLSSYSLSLMAIFYLQSIARPALLPPFSDLVEDVLRSTSLFASNQTVEESAWGRDGGLHVTSSGPFFAPALSLLEQLAIPPPPPPPPPVFEETASAEEAYQNSKPPKMPAGSAISKVTFLDPTPPVCQAQPPPPSQSKKAKKKAALLAATQQQQAAAAVATALATGDLSAFADLGLAQLGQATLESKNLPYYYTYYYYYYTYQMGLLSAQMAQQQQQAQASQVAATVSALANYKSPNTHSLGRLFSDFITFYSDRSVYDSVISVRSGRLMKRTDPLFARSFETCMDTFICIEEPFNHSNTSHSVHNDFMFNFIVKSFNWTRDSIAKMKLTLNDFV